MIVLSDLKMFHCSFLDTNTSCDLFAAVPAGSNDVEAYGTGGCTCRFSFHSPSQPLFPPQCAYKDLRTGDSPLFSPNATPSRNHKSDAAPVRPVPRRSRTPS